MSTFRFAEAEEVIPPAVSQTPMRQEGRCSRADDTVTNLPAAVDECVQYSRLIGSDPTLVLHGGGNSSVKARWRDITGREIDVLFVKGSGCEMGTIRRGGLRAARATAPARAARPRVAQRREMMRELAAARLDPMRLRRPWSPCCTHFSRFLPCNTATRCDRHAHEPRERRGGSSQDVLGDAVVVVPYVMPGFELAREVRRIWPEQAHDETRGMVLLNHGLFTFGATSREAYERHLDLLETAERWLSEHAPVSDAPEQPGLPEVSLTELAELRRAASRVAGRPLILQRHTDALVRRFVARADLVSLASRGPLTPDHVIRTKPRPLVGRDVAAFAESYAEYFAKHAPHARTQPVMLDPAPRVILDDELGMITAGASAHEAQVVADIYHHTIPVLERAEDHLGGYVALPPARLFDVEYWELEQAKLRHAGEPSQLGGTVALVTGSASGIGRACAEALLARGVAVAGLDVSPDVATCFTGPAWNGTVADVTDPDAVGQALRKTVEAFGGVDIAVIAAGLFGPSAPIASLGEKEWRSVQAVNVDSVLRLLRDLHPLLARSPVGGRVVVIGSKNVAAPGRGAAAYSASKAALTQLSRVAALEWADDGIRVNLVHPDAVFDTSLWTPELLAERARLYGVDVETYKRRNLLGAEVTSADVARVVVALCDDTFRATTGAQIPVDGGNERVV
jgi:rhamnose utilization protein RhaD (predicted bifunctional aldolase and dehydrogenase)/NAD(P)-dependent dehydrogenase (short-subunit alcohol dehydrogenase family)